MNFHALEMEVIRHAEANKLLNGLLYEQAAEVSGRVSDLCDSIAHGTSNEDSEAIGRTVIELIILCAMLDIDLAKCLEQAFEKISAKPEAPSNVLFLKKE